MSSADASATASSARAAITPNKIEEYKIDLHYLDHRFRKGHRIMVQVQSSWFPVIDRNPQRYVDNIFKARRVRLRQSPAASLPLAAVPFPPRSPGREVSPAGEGRVTRQRRQGADQ
jgi:predicted acyl esterase